MPAEIESPRYHFRCSSRKFLPAKRCRFHSREGSTPAPAWRHVGLYVYRRECLLRLAALPPTEMERAEALEQLRALEYGIRIKAVETRFDSIGVDTPDDLERVRATFRARPDRPVSGEPAGAREVARS